MQIQLFEPVNYEIADRIRGPLARKNRLILLYES